MEEKLNSGASLSWDGKYRYQLWRIWNNRKPRVMFLMLNPSTADAKEDDPTIRRCINYAKSWGYGGIYVCNLFGYRATNPKELLTVHNPFGDQNIFRTQEFVKKSDKVICAWGNTGIIKRLIGGKQGVSDLLNFIDPDKLHALELSKDGTPKHPLYLKGTLQPVKYNPFI